MLLKRCSSQKRTDGFVLAEDFTQRLSVQVVQTGVPASMIAQLILSEVAPLRWRIISV